MTTEKIAIIHTGFHKTGSSSLQHSLAHNRALLKAHGYDYPDICLKGMRFYNRSVPLYGRYCDHPEKFRHYWYHNELDASFANKKIDNLFEGELWGKEKLVFSDEFVSISTHSELARLRDDFKAHGYNRRVISDIREPFNSTVSVAQQKVRRHSLERTLKGNGSSQDVKKISNLIDVFETDAEFYSFEKVCQHAAGPVGFFFDLIGINLPVERTLRVNEGMSGQSVRLLSFINGAAPQVHRGTSVNPIRRKSDALPLSKIKGDKFQLTSDEVEIVKPKVLQARESIAAILGEDFLPPVSFSYSDKADWGSQQLEYLLKISSSLDLHLLLRVHDFLAELDVKEESACVQRNQLSTHIRSRLDKELQKSRRLPDMTKLAKRLGVFELGKYLRSIFIKAH